MKLASRQIDRDVRSCAVVVRVKPRTSRSHRLTNGEGTELQKEVALFGQGNEDARGHPTTFGMKPAHQGLETNHFVRRQVHDGLEVRDQLTGVKRVTKFLHQRQLTDGWWCLSGSKITWWPLPARLASKSATSVCWTISPQLALFSSQTTIPILRLEE